MAAVTMACTTMEEPKSVGSSEAPEQNRTRVNVTELYETTCAKCHGSQGQGGGGGTKSLNTLEKYDQKWDRPFFDAIKKGVPDMGMEAYGDSLSDEQIWALVVHIRELQYQALRKSGMRPQVSGGVYSSKHHRFKVETVVDSDQGLSTPWAIEWLPDGRMLITNRGGTLSIAKDGKVVGKVNGIPEVIELGQGGLMDITLHPNYKSNGWIYLAYTEPAKSGRGGLTKIVRGKVKPSGTDLDWTDQQTIWEADQKWYTGAGVHFGSRIVFDGKGHVWFVVGERGGNLLAQELTNPFGKTYRLNEDGSEPKDNPFVGTPDAIKGIWSYGHRNQQGLAMDLKGDFWVTEHGPRGGDEVNKIEKGANYGWPVVAFSINYNDTPFRTPWTTEKKITMPVFRWLPSIGACGLDVYRGKTFAKWSGDLLAGGLSGQNLDRIRVQNGALVEREELIFGMGRVREVIVGPDGYVYIALNGPDKVVRLVPAE